MLPLKQQQHLDKSFKKIKEHLSCLEKLDVFYVAFETATTTFR